MNGTIETMDNQDMIERIIKRARQITPTGYATLIEMNELCVPNGRLSSDPRYTYGTPLISSELMLRSSIRPIEWLGGSEGEHLDHSGRQIIKQRHWVANLVEILLAEKVKYSIPFPAHGMVDDDHDRAMWKISQERLEQCNPIYLGLIREILKA